MAKSGSQTEKGKAFEYVCAMEIIEKYKDNGALLIDSVQLGTARRCFFYLQEAEKRLYIKGAKAAIKIIDRFEPQLKNGSGNLSISLQTDSKGIEGDVRDVVCRRGSNWEIGISCKHNHEAIKHSRLSDTIDFGKEWFGKRCSDEYFSEVRKIFTPLREIRDKSKYVGKAALWETIKDKEDACYVPILNAFIKELKRLDQEYPRQIPELLIRYLIGRNDFYKVIMNDKRGYTQIESMNINGSLNQPSGRNKALIDVPVMKMPTKFYEIGYKENSKNTILVICDNGWNVSMRIHNASSKIEPSLKFDVQLIAKPFSIMPQIEPWNMED